MGAAEYGVSRLASVIVRQFTWQTSLILILDQNDTVLYMAFRRTLFLQRVDKFKLTKHILAIRICLSRVSK